MFVKFFKGREECVIFKCVCPRKIFEEFEENFVVIGAVIKREMILYLS